VISPVTYLAGVTSNAKFFAALPSGTSCTSTTSPAALRPLTCVCSRALRSSIGICATPSVSFQSMLDDGAAT
jgi:hypothetical protein